MNYTPAEHDYVMKHLDDMTIGAIARQLNKGRKSLFTFLRNHKVSLEEHPALYDVPTEGFRTVQLPEAAYLLGFIWADGHLSRATNGVIIDCVKEDLDVLEHVFDKTGEWLKSTMSRSGKRPSRVFKTYNRALCDYLVSKGYGEKSLRSPSLILEIIPKHLRHYFWRGYFDGDGCVYLNKRGAPKVTIAGAHDQDWSDTLEMGRSLGIDMVVRQRTQAKNRSSAVHIESQHHSLLFLKWIYQGFEQDRIGLTRKHEKFTRAETHVAKRPLSNTGYIGVTKVKSGRYTAKVVEGGVGNKILHHLGTFDNPKEAARAYDREAVRLRGLATRVNFPSAQEVTLSGLE